MIFIGGVVTSPNMCSKLHETENALTYINKLINMDKCDVGEKYC